MTQRLERKKMNDWRRFPDCSGAHRNQARSHPEFTSTSPTVFGREHGSSERERDTHGGDVSLRRRSDELFFNINKKKNSMLRRFQHRIPNRARYNTIKESSHEFVNPTFTVYVANACHSFGSLPVDAIGREGSQKLDNDLSRPQCLCSWQFHYLSGTRSSDLMTKISRLLGIGVTDIYVIIVGDGVWTIHSKVTAPMCTISSYRNHAVGPPLLCRLDQSFLDSKNLFYHTTCRVRQLYYINRMKTRPTSKCTRWHMNGEIYRSSRLYQYANSAGRSIEEHKLVWFHCP